MRLFPLPLSAAVLIVVGIQCTAHDRFVATGDSLALLGQQFAATAAMMDQGLDRGAVSVEQYRAWRDFGEKFKPSYSLAVELWKIARRAQDAKLEAQAAEVLAQLSIDLARFYDAVAHPAPSDGG